MYGHGTRQCISIERLLSVCQAGISPKKGGHGPGELLNEILRKVELRWCGKRDLFLHSFLAWQIDHFTVLQARQLATRRVPFIFITMNVHYIADRSVIFDFIETKISKKAIAIDLCYKLFQKISTMNRHVSKNIFLTIKN